MKKSLCTQTVGWVIGRDRHLLVLIVAGVFLACCGCRTAPEYRQEADEVASEIITEKQAEAIGRTEPFSVQRPSDILRRRILEEQDLAYSSEASLGTDKLPPIAHWPDDEYPSTGSSPDANIVIEPNQPLKLSLLDTLQVGARNSSSYQSRKEDVFRAALALDLERNNFRNIFRAQVDSQLTTTTTGPETVTTLDTGGSTGVTRTLKNGLDLSAALAIDLANLLTQGGASSLGLAADTSVSIPLLRGAGRHIVTEPLIQAERNIIYEIWDFERFKRTFALSVAREYFSVLRQVDSVKNSEDNYRSAVLSARWSRRRADAGLMDIIEVGQAVQRELQSRNQWISSQEQLKSRLDGFKTTIGLPPDARVELDRADLDQLQSRAEELLERAATMTQYEAAETAPPADAPVEPVPAGYEDAGPFEIEEALAVQLALDNRMDLRVANASVYDSQRQVVIRADALRTGLDVGGSASFSDNDDDGSLDFEGGRYAAFLSLDLPLERTAERNAYRNSLINLERATRSVQTLEDDIKLSIRNALRTLLNSRESLKIQAQSVVLAETRVNMSNLSLEAGRVAIRDLLEAQDDLLAAKNLLTAELISYRIAELELQRDMGVLQVNEQGLWEEFDPEGISNGNAE